ncbi:hypothetical protein G7Y79_00021g050140 [Physcia stellaris]|nr:hypothetical protein G7Y79_00021g050140 [Physcia stellaris]
MSPTSYSNAILFSLRLYILFVRLSIISFTMLKGLTRVVGELVLFIALLILDTAFFLLRLAGMLLLRLDAVNIVQSCNPALEEEEPQLVYNQPPMAMGGAIDENGAVIPKEGASISEANPEPKSDSETVTTGMGVDSSPSLARPLMVGLHPIILDAEVVALYTDWEDGRVAVMGRDTIGRKRLLSQDQNPKR